MNPLPPTPTPERQNTPDSPEAWARLFHTIYDDQDICGLCGEPGAAKRYGIQPTHWCECPVFIDPATGPFATPQLPDASAQEKVQPLSDCEYCHGPHAVSDCPEIAKLLKEKGGETCATMKVQAASQSAPVTKKQEAPTAKSIVASNRDREVQLLPVAQTPLSPDERADVADFYVEQMKSDPQAKPQP